MKKANEKGITMVTLVITVIVLIIITAIGVSTGSEIIKKANLQNINTNMMLIQAKVKTISEQAKFNKDTSNYKGTKVSEISGNEQIDKLQITDKENCYLLSQTDLDSMGLEKITIDEGYVVNYNTNEVMYVKGFETEDTTYYNLTDMKNLSLE